ncbi:hypothetical protein RJT34_30123 [Clitoria ternatea]|uniref:Uncharacterized protein n=1 Tax=Clitoria ternatea TaxID=43366 RepID=A0AAN9ESU7_CLITE
MDGIDVNECGAGNKVISPRILPILSKPTFTSKYRINLCSSRAFSSKLHTISLTPPFMPLFSLHFPLANYFFNPLFSSSTFSTPTTTNTIPTFQLHFIQQPTRNIDYWK